MIPKRSLQLRMNPCSTPNAYFAHFVAGRSCETRFSWARLACLPCNAFQQRCQTGTQLPALPRQPRGDPGGDARGRAGRPQPEGLQADESVQLHLSLLSNPDSSLCHLRELLQLGSRR